MANFSHLTQNSNPKTYKGGYKDAAYFCPLADFDVVASTVVVPAAVGDTVKITDDHTFLGTNGFFNWETKQDSVKITSSSVGDAGSRLQRYKAEFSVIGDGEAIQEQIERLQNTKAIFLFKDSACLSNDYYVQFGDECDSPSISAEQDSATKAEGSKVWKVTVEVTAAKYFYYGAVTQNTA